MTQSTLPIDAMLLAGLLCIVSVIVSAIVRATIGRSVAFALLASAGAIACAAGIAVLHAGSDAANYGNHLALRLDGVSAFFVVDIGAIGAVCGIFAFLKRRSDERGLGLHAAGSAATVLFAALAVCVADDVWLFVFAWELLALAFAWAIAFSGRREHADRAAYFTLVTTHAAGAALLGALLFLTAHGGTSVADATAAFADQRPAISGVVFVALLIGFGAKIGVFPMQGWMPYGYPSAPGPVAALMAGGALNVGFYGIERFVVASPVHVSTWWAILVLALGSIGAVTGIIWALAQRDLRVLAAFSSVENAGIILVGIGVALCGRVVSQPLLVGFGIAAAAVQILAHSFAKATLFLVTSDVEDATATTSFDLLGGLWRSLPVTTTAALAASLSLAALPPFGGFAGEWLSLEACMQAFRTGVPMVAIALALAGASIALAAGVAVVAFVKTAGIAFLGAPRSPGAAKPNKSRHPLAALAYGLLIAASIAVGSFTPHVLALFAPAVDSIAGIPVVAAMVQTQPLVQPPFDGFSSTSAFALVATSLAFAIGFRVLVALVPRPAPRRVPTWTSGGAYHPWTQYTGTGFANASRVVLDFIARIVRTTTGTIETSEALTYESRSRPIGDLAAATTLMVPILRLASLVRKVQSGSIAAYLSYILIFAVSLLVLYPSLRHW